MEQSERRFAILIDADNAPPKYTRYTLDEVNDRRIVTYKRIYGSWTDNEKRSWKNMPLDWSVNPIQQCSHATEKNATDPAMVIDTTDILYLGNADGFCPVSSDSDFTKLAQRFREARMFIMGVGEQKTPEPFRVACDTFKLLEVISSDDVPEATVIENQETITSIDEVRRAITKFLIENNSQSQPIIPARVGNFLTKWSSDFDVRNYGYSKLSTFPESLDNNDFQVAKFYGGLFVQGRSVSISKIEVGKATARTIRENNGHVDNLSTVHDGLKKVFPPFDVKQYGFNHISGFIRSFGSFKTEDNMVQMK